MIEDVIKTIIQNKGWLALESLTFNNEYHCRIQQFDGRIALDTDQDVLYLVTGMDTLMSDTLKGRVVIFDDRDLSSLKMVSAIGFNYVERFALSTFAKPPYYADGKDMPIPIIPKDIAAMESLPKYDQKNILEISTQPESELIKIYPDKECYMRTAEITRFYTNQAKFKQFLQTYLGILPINLL